MADILVQGDTGPLITGVIHKKDIPAQVTNLAGATVKFQMRNARHIDLHVDAAADIITEASGTVSYSLEANDTAIPGDYVYQWQVLFPDSTTQTTYEAKELTIRPR
jgi:hypothetical protein